MTPSQLDGYLQGFRFSDDAQYYDAATKHFYDLAGYEDLGNGMTFDVGTPAFATVNSARALNNTTRGRFLMPHRWQGTMVIAMKPNMAINTTIYPLLFSSSLQSAGSGFRIVRANAASYTYRYYRNATSPNYVEILKTSNGILVAAFASDQQTRRFYSQEAGGSVTTASEIVAGTDSGNLLALGVGGQDANSMQARLGNCGGDFSDTTTVTEGAHIFEMHFFDSNLFVTDPNGVDALLDTIAAAYPN
jgi:hypothetical protein